MAELFSVYKCLTCGNIVELIHPGGGELVCCGKPMQLMTAGAVDAAQEKHVPVLEATPKGCKVKVGSAAHPMEEKHFIEWVEITTACGRHYKKFLKPGAAPEAEFCIPADKVTTVREYCNLHGLWKRA